MIKKVIKIILVLICMITIFTFSSDSSYESTKKSNKLIITFAEIFNNKDTVSVFKEELKNYFKNYNDRFNFEDGSRVRSYYEGFKIDISDCKKIYNKKAKGNTKYKHYYID